MSSYFEPDPFTKAQAATIVTNIDATISSRQATVLTQGQATNIDAAATIIENGTAQAPYVVPNLAGGLFATSGGVWVYGAVVNIHVSTAELLIGMAFSPGGTTGEFQVMILVGGSNVGEFSVPCANAGAIYIPISPPLRIATGNQVAYKVASSVVGAVAPGAGAHFLFIRNPP